METRTVVVFSGSLSATTVDEYIVQVERKEKMLLWQPGDLRDLCRARTVCIAAGRLELQIVIVDVLWR